MPPVIDLDKCNACGICDDHCPLDVLYLEDDVVDVRYPDECWHCGACRQDCPTGAVRIEFPLMMLSV
ncbi:MAG: 4Fe-4S dicluster domain-containing protein [Desulfobacterales bacterium]|jgi:NAD-dependent dihydropyrimidine dehydrogenase PreA subunit